MITRSKKKKKSCAIREDDLSKKERTRTEIIAMLCEKYRCSLHKTPCYIQNNRHLQLNSARLQLWAREIVSYSAINLIFYLIFTKLIYYNR